VRDFRPIVRESNGRFGSSTWPSGASVWGTETEGRYLAVDQVEVSDGTPVEVNEMTADSSAYVFRYEFGGLPASMIPTIGWLADWVRGAALRVVCPLVRLSARRINAKHATVRDDRFRISPAARTPATQPR
jgi:hypothetical protein